MTVFRLAAAGLLAAAAAVVIGASTADASDWPSGSSRSASDGNEWLLGPDCSDWPSGISCAALDGNDW